MDELSTEERGFRHFFRELRRRHVLETAGIYVAAGWLLIEVADILFPVFGVPESALRIVVVSVFSGFPVILVLSWVFDISLRGLIRTPDAAVPSARNFDFSTVPQRSIAVLPFANMTGGADNEYLGDGLAEELLNLLARIDSLKVAARTSSFAFRGKDADIRDIGALLGVRHVLEGSVRQAGSRIRITAQLIEAPTGFHLWSETFDRTLDDIFAIQDEISAAIVEALEIALAGKGSQKRSSEQLPTDNIDAYQYFLRATYLWQRRGAEAIQGAINALEQAVALDSNYAEAYARLASAEAILHEFTQEEREPGFVRAESYARKAISLDPQMGEPHAVLGYMAMRLWRWPESAAHMQRAIQIQDTIPTLHQWYSNLLHDLGRHEEAQHHASYAHTLDPLSPTANNLVGFTAFLMAKNEEALKHAALAREYGIGGGIPDIVDFVVSLRLGRRERAHSIWLPYLHRAGCKPDAWLDPVIDAILQPQESELQHRAATRLQEARQAEAIDNRHLFFHSVLVGSPGAFDVAETMLRDHSLAHVWMFLPEAAPLHHHERFLPLMEKVGIVDYWRRHGWPEPYQHLSS